MAEKVRLAARGREGPAADENELSSIAAGPDCWGTRGVRARNLNVRVTDGNMAEVCLGGCVVLLSDLMSRYRILGKLCRGDGELLRSKSYQLIDKGVG